MHCKSCDEWFHAMCLKQTEQQLRNIGREKFCCNWCVPYVQFIDNLSKEKGCEVPELSDCDEMDEDENEIVE